MIQNIPTEKSTSQGIRFEPKTTISWGAPRQPDAGASLAEPGSSLPSGRARAASQMIHREPESPPTATVKTPTPTTLPKE